VGIVVAEDTTRAIPDYAWREIDRVRVVGKLKPVTIYEPLGPSGSPELVAELAQHRQALASYRERDFAAAEAGFAALAAAHPATPLYAYLRARCAAFRLSPPPPAWEGATVFATK
jgi:adenylate cyclase